MTDGEFPFRSFTMRSEGYDRDEVDAYLDELRSEITELRRALETSSASRGDEGDTRLHDPEGAVTRTLAIAQETADRVMHDAQVEADRRRAEADEHAVRVVADADERSARLLSEMEAQAAEVREQGIAAARSAIQVERDKAMAELVHIRRVRDDLRAEATDLKGALDRYRNQALEASDVLTAAASGPLMSADLPEFIDDEVGLAGLRPVDAEVDAEVASEPATAFANAADDGPSLRVVDALPAIDDEIVFADDDDIPEDLAPEDLAPEDLVAEPNFEDPDLVAASDLAGDDVLLTGDAFADATEDNEADPADGAPADGAPADGDADEGEDDGFGSGTFLAEIRAAAEDDDIALEPENDDSDRFLTELRTLSDDADGVSDEAAEAFFQED